MEKQHPGLVKKFALAGLILGEIYMVLAVSAPRLRGVEIPWDALALRLLSMSLLFGPFGLAVGTGLGLLVDGVLRSKSQKSTGDKK